MSRLTSISFFVAVVVTLGAQVDSVPDCAQNGFFPDDENCRFYYDCEQGEPIRVVCEADWLFDATNKYCDYPDRVDCGSRPVCDEDGQNCVEHHVTTPTPLPECTITCVDDGFFEYEKCSAFFCHCSVGHPYLEECQDGLIFNPELGGCDWDYNVEGCTV
ncbi:hypothetical protein TCAL_04786 [Tigriopus californicus]|uniref:Chitin-binding type-2 domain-containing protein n=1 Tax=Tigriopus californicus TaxID=6832 RepID=A0A553PDJ6_TIGCA|nr:probable endochitinase [Tigriopus californicus]TRY75760.1 hypothetical protein TCAL_04786 [Tigriopus californicus]